MSDKPIIFNDAMVRAILDGRKTQTRRVVKSIDHDLLDMMAEDVETEEPDSDYLGLKYGPSLDDNQQVLPDQWLAFCTECEEEGVMTLGKGYGQPGDFLWVREAHAPRIKPEDDTQNGEGVVWYRSAGRGSEWNGRVRWKPSIHMPRWASRITLEITDVRVERLQDISEEDAEAEGIEAFLDGHKTPGEIDESKTSFKEGESAKRCFRYLWESINGAGSWEENPWVWVIEFRPHLKNIDTCLSEAT